MRQDAKDISRHSTGRKNIQKFHGLHLEAKIAIYHEQNYVGNFGHVDHAGKGIGRTFHKSEATAFGGDNSDWTAG